MTTPPMPPAAEVTHGDLGRLTLRYVNSDGQPHNPHGPATITVRPDGSDVVPNTKSFHWFINGRFGRNAGPAFLLSELGGRVETVWRTNGVYRRADGPACTVSDGYIEWHAHLFGIRAACETAPHFTDGHFQY